MLISLAVTSQARAEAIPDVIDIRPIIDRHNDIGNALGLAYNPNSDELFLARGSHGGAHSSTRSISMAMSYVN